MTWRWITSLQCIFSCCWLCLPALWGSGLFLGCSGSKRKQRFHSLSLCFAWLSCREWGSPFRCSPSPTSCWPRKVLEKQEEVFGLCLSPTSSLIPKKIHWVLQGKNKFALNRGDVTSPEQRELCFPVGAVWVLSTQVAIQPL